MNMLRRRIPFFHLHFAMIRQHLATMTHGPCCLERQRGACVELGVVTAHSALSGVVTVTRPHSKQDGDAFGSDTRDRGAIANRRRAARRTRRLPVSSGSCAMSVRAVSCVSAAASRVNLHSRVPRVRSRNDSRWQHLTRLSSGATQYPVAQDGQDLFFVFAGLRNQPWATRQWRAVPASSRHDSADAWQ